MTEKQVLPGFLANVDVVPPLIVTFQFNPDEVDDNKAVKYADRNADLCGNAPGKVYTGGGDRTISFDLELHGLEQGSNRLNPTGIDNGISTELAKLRSFLYPKADAWATVSGILSDEGGKRLTSPPRCLFGFGAKVLECVVTDLRISETQFNSWLAPVRATVGVSLVVVEDEGNALYTVDKHRRNALAALGVQNVDIGVGAL